MNNQHNDIVSIVSEVIPKYKATADNRHFEEGNLYTYFQAAKQI